MGIEQPVYVSWIENGHKYGGWVADMVTSPLTGRARLRIVDFVREIDDQDAGTWKYASDCEEE